MKDYGYGDGYSLCRARAGRFVGLLIELGFDTSDLLVQESADIEEKFCGIEISFPVTDEEYLDEGKEERRATLFIDRDGVTCHFKLAELED